jgi:hypothetical protein
MSDPNMTAAFIGALTSLVVVSVTSLFAWLRWRRDVHIKLEQIRDDVTAELIRQRVKPYANFIKALEPMSSLHKKEIEADPQIANSFANIFQEAIYGSVGILASHDTREFIVYARLSCVAFAQNIIKYEDWLKSVWAVSLALRSDLGITQPDWDNEIDRLRRQNITEGIRSIAARGPLQMRWIEAEKMREMIRTTGTETASK